MIAIARVSVEMQKIQPIWPSVRAIRIRRHPQNSPRPAAPHKFSMNSRVGHHDFAAQMPAFLSEDNLSSKCTPAAPLQSSLSSTRSIRSTAKAGLRIRDDWREPIICRTSLPWRTRLVRAH